jgi:uncharacterized protein (DUF433 family)
VPSAEGQLTWESLIADRLAEFDYEYGLALIWHVAGRGSRITIDPRISFGAPTVSGIPTWILKGRWQAGETVAEIAEDFGLVADEIHEALEFEGIREAA